MDDCISYTPSLYEYIIPSPVVLQRLCLSYDRTDLFIVSVIRMFLWIMLVVLFTRTLDNRYINMSIAVLRYILIIIVGINLLYIGMVVAKNPVLSMGANESVLGYKHRNSRENSIPYEADYS
jgi:general stress protein CsbA